MPRKTKEEVRAELEARLAALDVKDNERKRSDRTKAQERAKAIQARITDLELKLNEQLDIITVLSIELGDEANASVDAIVTG